MFFEFSLRQKKGQVFARLRHRRLVYLPTYKGIPSWIDQSKENTAFCRHKSPIAHDFETSGRVVGLGQQHSRYLSIVWVGREQQKQQPDGRKCNVQRSDRQHRTRATSSSPHGQECPKWLLHASPSPIRETNKQVALRIAIRPARASRFQTRANIRQSCVIFQCANCGC